MKVIGLSAPHTGCLYPPGNISGTRFYQRLSWPRGYSAARRIMSMKNSSNTIGNRTCDLPACSAVPQPTVPPRAPCMHICKQCQNCKKLLSRIWLLSSCTWRAQCSSVTQLWLHHAAVDYTWYQYVHLVTVMSKWKDRVKGIHKMLLFSSSNIKRVANNDFSSRLLRY
jgi:hypothetical protein